MHSRKWFLRIWTILLFAVTVMSTTPAMATWSIVATDTETQEVAVASATCVTNFDLRAVSPALVVGIGGGAAQSLVDSSGVRRQTMRNSLLAGQSSTQIMQQLQGISGSASHQNGLADAGGDSATFSGSSTGAFSSGLTGSFGTTFYAIQGNLLTGNPVLTMAEQALVNTAGDLPAKMMAAMEAARQMGGDGRCSCPGSVTGCGSPPPSFSKSAHIGYFIVSRFGDSDGSCGSGGCAQGNYFMNFNIANQGSGALDPVFQLQSLFDAERQALENRPDAITSTVSFQPSGVDDSLLVIEARDWRDLPVTSGINSVTVVHASDSAGISQIGPVNSVGNGRYEVLLTRGSGNGTDRFRITLDDGTRPVVLPPKRAVLPLTGGGGGGGLSEDFESGLGGWTTTGLWHLVNTSSCATPGYSSPVQAVYFGQDSTCNYSTGSAASGDLISPAISGIDSGSTLSFDYFRQVESFSGGSFDRTEVAVSATGSSTWTTVWSRDSTDASAASWTASGPISLASFAGSDVQVRFRFNSVDEQFNTFTGWFIDDVEVTSGGGGGGGGGGGCVELHNTDFESGANGWTHSGSNSTCTTGSWLVGNPDPVTNSGVVTQLGDDHTAAPGVNAFFTQPNSGGAGSDDVDGGVCTALSPVIDASSDASVELSLWYYHGQRDTGDDASGDFFTIDISTDGGATFPTRLVSIGDTRTQAAWTELSTTISNPGQLRIRVQASDGSSAGDLIEGGIDDVVICAPR